MIITGFKPANNSQSSVKWTTNFGFWREKAWPGLSLSLPCFLFLTYQTGVFTHKAWSLIVRSNDHPTAKSYLQAWVYWWVFVCKVPLFTWTRNLRKYTKKLLGKYEYTCASVWRLCPAGATHHKWSVLVEQRQRQSVTQSFWKDSIPWLVNHTGCGWLLMLSIQRGVF